MQAQYTREVNHCYMILQSSEPFDEASYELNMIAANRIPSLLPMSISHIDRTAICQYDISSLQPLSVFCSSRKIHEKELTKLLGNLLDSLFLMEDYLLSEEHLFLDPEHLYLNWSALEFRIAYVPFYSCDLRTSLLNLMEYLLGCLENDDQNTVVLAYRICHELKEPNLQLCDLRKILLAEHPLKSGNSDASMAEYSAPALTEPLLSAAYNDTVGPGSDSDHFLYPDRKKDRVPISDESPGSSFEMSGLRKFLPEKETWKTILLGVPTAVFIYAILHIYALGYLPLTKAVGIIAGILALLILFLILLHKRHDASDADRLDDFPPLPSESAAPYKRSTPSGRNLSDSPGPDDLQHVSPFFGHSRHSGQEEHSANSFDDSSSLFAPFPEDERTVLLHPSVSQETDSAALQRLVPVTDEHHNNLPVIELDSDSLLIGFQSEICDKVIPDPTVSRIHARIEKRDGIFYLTDLSSRNGTFVNDRQIGLHEEIPLQAGISVRFGAAPYKVQQFTP